MIDRKEPHKLYSHLYVFVCNIPDEQYATSMEKDILAGLKAKWAAANDDPKCERLHIIYLEEGDQPHHPKFTVLNHVDRMSKIYIVGHCAPGANSMYSDDLYVNHGRKNKKYAKFSFVDLVRILMLNIDDQEIVVPDKQLAYLPLMSKSRKLKIHLLACNTATDDKTIFGTVKKPSFASKFAYCAHNAFNATLVCDIIGIDGWLIPVGTKPDLINAVQYILGSNTFEPGFHRRYMQTPYARGNFNFNFFTYLPEHKPDYRYKVLIAPSPQTSAQQVAQQDIKHIKLGVHDANNRAIEQNNGERTLQLIQHILRMEGLSHLHVEAENTRNAIRTGNIKNSDIVKAHHHFMHEMNDYFNPKASQKFKP